MNFYDSVVRPLIFQIDPERAHHMAIDLCAAARWLAPALCRYYTLQDSRLEMVVGDLRFPTPLGLAAGFDKNGFGDRDARRLGVRID